jgi:ATP-dependent exoDNAse (exonuclease V) alpha subunit
MANFHLEFECISRKQGRSPIRAANYQSGERLRDDYYGHTYYRRRLDVLHTEILLPKNAPSRFYDRQTLWREVDRAEKRSDSRTARRVIALLPNEIALAEQIELVREYVTDNFISMGMCADVAIHEVRNENDPAKNNPHVHILLTDRPVDRNGFLVKKNRDWNMRKNIRLWREQWARAQNRAYARNGLEVRVTDKGYIEREVFKREPKRYLCRGDMCLERQGIRTARGDENRAIEAKQRERELKREQKRKKRRSRGRGR